MEIDFIFPTEFNGGRPGLLTSRQLVPLVPLLHLILTIIVEKLTLQEESTFEEVIWLFSRAPDKKNRITLQQNLQFYDHRLDEALHSLRMYQIFDSLHPIDTPSKAKKQTYYVLLDRPVRLLFELRRPRIFGNIWKLGDGAGIIFKGLSRYNITYQPSDTQDSALQNTMELCWKARTYDRTCLSMPST